MKLSRSQIRVLNEIPLQALIKKVPTPFYAYSLDHITRQVMTLKSGFKNQVDLHYAMKANSNPDILRHLKGLGLGVDTVSAGEIKAALKAGFSPQNVIFSGVGKTEEELTFAIQKRIKLINVESIPELERIGGLAILRRRKVSVAFRLNPNVDIKGHPYITTGLKRNKFGMPFQQLPELLRVVRKFSPYISLEGVDFHIGSQILSIAPLAQAIKKTIPVFENLRSQGFPMKYFDVGGGVGIRYKDENPPDLKRYGRTVLDLLKPTGARILSEPGRVLVGEAGVLVTEVQYVKETVSKTFLIVDTGMHHLLRPSLYSAYHPMVSVEFRKNRKARVYDVVGPICESTDVLAYDRSLPEMRQGEHLAILNAGAYGFSMASRYNLHRLPTEVVVDRRRTRISRS